jgi:hypothetical protein
LYIKYRRSLINKKWISKINGVILIYKYR